MLAVSLDRCWLHLDNKNVVHNSLFHSDRLIFLYNVYRCLLSEPIGASRSIKLERARSLESMLKAGSIFKILIKYCSSLR